MFKIKRKRKEDDLTYLERAYNKILKNNPESFLYLPLASVYYRKGNIDKAITTLHDSLLVHPNYITAKSYLAFLYNKAGEPDKAVELFKKVVLLSPDNYAAHKALAEYYIERKDENKRASAELNILARLVPFDKQVRNKINQLKNISDKNITSSFSRKGDEKSNYIKKEFKIKEKQKSSDNVISSLEEWIKNIDKRSHEAASCCNQKELPLR